MIRKAIDCETTGLDLRHGCKPFFVSITDEYERVRSWEWRVFPYNRQPTVPQSDIDEIQAEIDDPDTIWVGHNIGYDTLALTTVLPRFDPIAFLKRAHDTQIRGHIIDSSRSHGLKDMAVRFVDIGDSDQTKLKDCVNDAIVIAKKFKFAVASKETLPLQAHAPKVGWWVCDMWVPAAVWRFIDANKDDPIFNLDGITLAKRVDLRNVLKTKDIAGWLESHKHWLTVCPDYGNGDTYRTIVLEIVLGSEIEANGLTPVYEKQRQLLPVIYQMQENGVAVHYDEIDSEIDRLTLLREHHADEARRISGLDELNIDSGDELAYVVYDHFGREVVARTDKTLKPSANKTVLEGILKSETALTIANHAEDIANGIKLDDLLKECRDYQFALNVICSKKCGTSVKYLKSYKRAALLHSDGSTRLHPNYNSTGTKTTRFSSNNPNGTNVSKGKDAFVKELADFNLSLRKIFGPPDGYEWYTIDYVQLQLVILAYVSGEPSMIAAVERGDDFHTFMTQQIFDLDQSVEPDEGQRRIGKNVDFGFVFGASERKIESTAKKPGLYKYLKQLFPDAIGFIKRNMKLAKQEGRVWAADYPLIVPADRPHAATNYRIQGWEGLIVKLAMYLVHYYLEEYCPSAFMTLQVHDELVLQFPIGQGAEHIGVVCYLMEDAGRKYGVPCKVDAKYVDHSWNKGIPVKFIA